MLVRIMVITDELEDGKHCDRHDQLIIETKKIRKIEDLTDRSKIFLDGEKDGMIIDLVFDNLDLKEWSK